MSQMSAKAPSRAASRQSAVIVVSGSDFVIIRGTWCRCVYWCSTHARRMAPRRVRLQSALPLGVLLLSAPRAVRVLSAGYTGLMLRETARTRLKAPFACSRRPAFCRERAASHKKCPVFAGRFSPGISYLALPPKAPIARDPSETPKICLTGPVSLSARVPRHAAIAAEKRQRAAVGALLGHR